MSSPISLGFGGHVSPLIFRRPRDRFRLRLAAVSGQATLRGSLDVEAASAVVKRG